MDIATVKKDLENQIGSINEDLKNIYLPLEAVLILPGKRTAFRIALDFIDSLQQEQQPAEWKPLPESMEALLLAIEGKWDAIKPTGYMSRRLEDLYDGLVNTFEVIVQSEQGTNKCPRMKYYKPTSNVRSGKDSARSKRVAQYTKDGTLIMEWDCISDAVRMLGVSGPGISECIKGTHKTAGGYIWKVIN